MPTFTTHSDLPRTFISSAIAARVFTSDDNLSVTIDPETLKDNCGICLLPLTSKEVVRNPNCTHILHLECLDSLFKTSPRHISPKCPFCRADWCSNVTIGLGPKHVRDTLRSLENGELRFPGPLSSDDVGMALVTAANVFAYCMQVSDIPPRSESTNVAEEELIHKAATSPEGHQFVHYILRWISQITIHDLRACTAVDEFGTGANVWTATDDVLDKMLRSLSKSREDANYKDVWVLVAWVLQFTAPNLEIWKRLEEPECKAWLTFGVRVAVWSLISCIKRLESESAGIPVVAVAEGRDVQDLSWAGAIRWLTGVWNVAWRSQRRFFLRLAAMR